MAEVVLTFILAGAEVELVPDAVAGHPSVRSQVKGKARRPTDLLLDQNSHQAACRKLPDGERRGRPDITHYLLLVLLESPLAKEGKVQVALHTRHGELIRFRPDVRLPRGEARFQGLLAKVLREGASDDSKTPLVWREGVLSPKEVVGVVAKGEVVRLDEGGPLTAPRELVKQGDQTFVIGAFPSGDFDDAWQEATPRTAALFQAPLNAWAVAGELVAAYRAQSL